IWLKASRCFQKLGTMLPLSQNSPHISTALFSASLHSARITTHPRPRHPWLHHLPIHPQVMSDTHRCLPRLIPATKIFHVCFLSALGCYLSKSRQNLRDPMTKSILTLQRSSLLPILKMTQTTLRTLSRPCGQMPPLHPVTRPRGLHLIMVQTVTQLGLSRPLLLTTVQTWRPHRIMWQSVTPPRLSLPLDRNTIQTWGLHLIMNPTVTQLGLSHPLVLRVGLVMNGTSTLPQHSPRKRLKVTTNQRVTPLQHSLSLP